LIQLKKRHHLKDLYVGGDNIPMDFQGRGWKDVNWIHPAEGGDDDEFGFLKMRLFLDWPRN